MTLYSKYARALKFTNGATCTHTLTHTHTHTHTQHCLDLCFLDYARIVVLALWNAASPASMEANTKEHGCSMVTRSSRHLEWISRRAARLLQRLPLILATPPPHKFIMLIRHGEAWHNRRFAAAKAAAKRGATEEHNRVKAEGYNFHDALLTPEGEAAATELGHTLDAWLQAHILKIKNKLTLDRCLVTRIHSKKRRHKSSR